MISHADRVSLYATLGLLTWISILVDVSAQGHGSCIITPENPTTLTATGGAVVSGTTNVRIQCVCTGSSNVVRWYDMSTNLVGHLANPDGSPYSIRNDPDGIDNDVTLVIPTFTDSYDGRYNCGIFVSNTQFTSPSAAVTLTITGICPSLTAPNNGMISCSLGGDGVPSIGDACNFTCNNGYMITGSSTRTCQSDGTWRGSDAMCRRVSCPSLSDPDNGMINCVLGNDGVPSYEDTCTYTCNTGYELTGGRSTRNCQSDGTWSGSDTMCTRVSCPSLSDPDNGMIDCPLGDDGVPSYEDTCTYTCDTGYVLTGGSTRNCQSDGSWSGSDTMCTRVSCPSLSNPDNGMMSCSPLGDDGVPSYEDTCTFACNNGYELTGSSTRNCQSDGSWSGSDTMCTRVPCTSLSDPDNGMISCSLGDDGVPSYEDTCTYTCELTGGSSTRNCQSDGTWSGSDAICDGVSCQPLSDPDNGMISCSLGNDGVPSYEDNCTYTCDTGYELTGGSSIRNCQNDGTWSGSDAMCTRVSCPSLTDPDNGMISCSLGDDGVPSYEDTCTFACNNSYELTGSSTRNCQSDGSWSGSDNMCTRVSCPSLSDPDNGMISCQFLNDGIPSYEDTCTYTCDTGYELTGGSSTKNCQSDGTWSGNDTMCTRVSCTSLDIPVNGQISCSPLEDDGVPSYEDTCTFTCNTGYELIGVRNCQSDGTWSGSDTMCTRVSENVEPASDCNDDSNNTISLVLIALLIISFVINILFAIIIIYFVVKAKKTIYSTNNAAHIYDAPIELDKQSIKKSSTPEYDIPEGSSHQQTDPNET